MNKVLQFIKLANLPAKVRKHYQYLVYLFLGFFVRFANINTNLFFTWDSGRDAWKLAEIVGGDLTLIGPTSGLPGFFLGPMWFYAGIPGYLISQGNPYFISYWYIFLACLALPLFWYLSFLLFDKKKDRPWAVVTASLLAFIPGSIHGSTFIWNPLISLPLVTLGLISLLKAPKSRWWLALSFLSWALVLQSEFAYGIFFILPLFLLIGWIRKEGKLIDYLVSFLAVAITGIPQIVFEIKNNWLLTKSLLAGLQSQERLVTFSYLFSHRPQELIWVTYELLFRGIDQARVFLLILIPLFIYASYKVFKSKQYKWQVITLLAWIPYVFYMFWRGNYGNFFDYYVTPHFILLIPVLVYGLFYFYQNFNLDKNFKLLAIGVVIGWMSMASLNYIFIRINKDENNVGLVAMEKAMGTLYDWQQRDGAADDSAFRFFTPNSQTEHHDYLMHFIAKKRNLPVPMTYKTPETKYWYVLIEADRQIPEKRFVPWYDQVGENGLRIRSIKVGDLVVETWINRDVAHEKELLEVTSKLDFMILPAFPGIATDIETMEQLVK